MNLSGQLVTVAFFTVFSGALSAQSDLPRFGVGVSASTLGFGIQAATAVTSKSNVRAGFNIFDYDHTFNKDGVRYDGQLKLRSVQITWDQYFGALHISPGVLVYNGNSGNATATVPGGQSFSLGGNTFYSSVANPVNGSGTLSVNKAAPMILVGFGNLLPRSQRHFGINVEAGVVFEGSAKVRLNLGGTTCLTSAQTVCVNTATDPLVQSSVVAEQSKLNNDVGPFKYFPVVSVGFSYKF